LLIVELGTRAPLAAIGSRRSVDPPSLAAGCRSPQSGELARLDRVAHVGRGFE